MSGSGAKGWRIGLFVMVAACSDCKAQPTAAVAPPPTGADVAPSDDVVRDGSNDILTFQYDLSRTGVAPNETVLTPANVKAGTFGRVASLTVDGYVYAQPLFVSKVLTTTGLRDVVFIATEHDSVFAFDAATNDPLWNVSLLESGEVPVPSEDTNAPDISPEIGITGTPVIDRTAGLLYVVSKAKRADKTYVQRLHALRIADGTESAGAPVEIAAQLVSSAVEAKDGQLSFEPLRHNQRAALALIAGHVIIAWAGHGDKGYYHGWLMAYDTADLTKPPAAFVTTPDGQAGGIWMGASGPTADADGNIYVASGNGDFGLEDDGTRTNYSLSAIRLRLDPSGWAFKDYFSPHETEDLNTGDLDFGTSAPILLPDRAQAPVHRVVVAGKTGYLYVLNRDDLGGYDGDSDGDDIVQKLFTGSPFLISNPVLFNDTLYVLPHEEPLMAFSIDPATGLFGSDPTDIANACEKCFDRGSTPSISANGTKNAILWVLDNGGYKTGAPAILHAYDPTNLATELYKSSPILLDTDSAAPAVKFTVPAVADGRVFVGGQKAVTVYGLLAP